MTPKPSDSMRERARELAEVATKQTLMGYGAGFSSMKIIEILTPIIASAITAERTAAFNEGAGGAYEDMVQACLQPKKFTDVCTWKECAEIIRQRTPTDTLTAIERRVSQARLDSLQKVLDKMGAIFDTETGTCEAWASVIKSDIAELDRAIAAARKK